METDEFIFSLKLLIWLEARKLSLMQTVLLDTDRNWYVADIKTFRKIVELLLQAIYYHPVGKHINSTN